MSQAIFDTIVPSTTSGNQLAGLLNDFKNAIVSGFSGTSRPSQLAIGGYWIDTTNNASGLWDFKVYDGTQDIVIFTINKNTGQASISSADSLFEIAKISNDSVGPLLKLLKERVGTGQTLIGDVLGEIQFSGTKDDGLNVLQARVKSVATNNTTATQQGAFLSFELTSFNGASISEVMRLVDGKVAIGTTTPEETLHVVGSGIKAERIADDSVGTKLTVKKKRILSSGQVLSGDVVGGLNFNSTDEAGVEVEAASMEVTASENHTALAQGTKLVIKNKKIGEIAFTEQIEITDNVKVKTNLTVDGDFTVNGSTTTINTATLEVEDSNITVNKAGTQATANSSKAGIKVEMSNATHAQIGYDSSTTSKFVVGEVGSEKEIVDVSSVQTLTNKTLAPASITQDATYRFASDAEKASWNSKEPSIAAGTSVQYFRGDKSWQPVSGLFIGPSLESPTRLDAKKGTISALTTYASTATNGQFAFGTDNKRMYHVVDGVLKEIPTYKTSQAIAALDIDWDTGETFYKDVSASSTFTFSNVIDGRVISAVISNTSGVDITVLFPSGIYKESGSLLIPAGQASVYTFIRANSKTYLSSISNLVVS